MHFDNYNYTEFDKINNKSPSRELTVVMYKILVLVILPHELILPLVIF